MFQSLGLVFVAAQRLGNQALYALKDYRGPATLAGFTLLLNVALSLALLSPLGTGGLALANGLASLAGHRRQALWQASGAAPLPGLLADVVAKL